MLREMPVGSRSATTTGALLVALAGPAAAADAPTASGAPRAGALSRAFPAMGTEARLTIWTADTAGAERAFGAAESEMERVERLMTDWERPGWPPSDVVRINKAAGK